jgi:hypothetical protein
MDHGRGAACVTRSHRRVVIKYRLVNNFRKYNINVENYAFDGWAVENVVSAGANAVSQPYCV